MNLRQQPHRHGVGKPSILLSRRKEMNLQTSRDPRCAYCPFNPPLQEEGNESR